jgi:uncharacterized membrane protein
MKWIGRAFLTGLAAIVPVVVTLYLIYWLAATAETALGDLFRHLLPDGWYWSGMGLGAGLLLVFLIGLLMHAWLVQRLYGWVEGLLYRIPLIRSVYGSLRDLFNLFSQAKGQALHQTVALSWGEMRLIGFITRQDLSDLPPGIGAADDVIVFIPMSYNIGGYIVVVPRSAVQPIDMSVEDALRFTLTAGITGITGKQPPARSEPEK